MTTTRTVVAGQTWRRKEHTYRDVVAGVVEAEGVTFVLHRFEHSEPASSIRCNTIDEFLDAHEAPEWDPPANETIVRYAAVSESADGLEFDLVRDSEDAARADLARAASPVGVLVSTTTITYRWAADEVGA